MAKAFKCDICDQYFKAEDERHFFVGRDFNFSPSMKGDICPDCFESFKWWMGTRHPKHKTALAKPENGSGCGWVD